MSLAEHFELVGNGAVGKNAVGCSNFQLQVWK